ncbi:MAG: chloride channel protein [Actinomycetales bacterium]|nr:chloride channel protein [Leifsonia sp.]
MRRPTLPATPRWLLRLAVVTLLVGLGAGAAGAAVAAGLHLVQHLAYNYSEGTFLDGLLKTPPVTRVIALSVAGVVGAIGWWAMRKWGQPFVSVERSVGGKRMPAAVTLVNAALQVVIVGLGASIGREVAPRELGALVSGWLSDRAGVSARERRILVACGAGAGLAAVYNVPLGGAVFTVEILLAEISFATVLPAVATAAIATLVGHLTVPASALYALPKFTFTPSIVMWSVLVGPVMGFAAIGFVRLAQLAQTHRPKSWGILVVMPLVFASVGLLSVWFPAILGNGRSLAQIAFDATISAGLLAALLVFKVAATVGTIGSGAAGGTLTPSLAIGAVCGALAGTAWDLAWPGVPPAAFALIGAAAFLASSMRAPLTALILVLEFTGEGPSMIVPMMLAIAGSVAVGYVLGRRRFTGVD